MERNTNVLLITSVKRVRGRADLHLSNGEILSLPRAMLKERPYRGGMPFDRNLFDAFLRERAYSFGIEKAIALLASRARTEKEILDALQRNAYPEAAIARIMARLHEAGYLNDAEFAERWTVSRSSKGLGTRRIRAELRQKGISHEEINEAISSLDEDELLEGAVIAAQKASRGKQLSSPTDRQKIMAALARRGFDYSLAKRAIQKITDEHE